MMNSGEVNWMAAAILITIVVVINLGLWMSLTWRRHPSEFDQLRKITNAIKNPWQNEDQAMAELSRRVADLKAKIEQHQTLDNPDEHS